MKIALLSRGRMLYSTRRLAEAGRRRGHDVRIIDPHRCTILVDHQQVDLDHDGLSLRHFDCVIPRVGGSSSDMVISLLKQFELLGPMCLNSADGVMRSRDKFRSLQELASAGLPVPRTMMLMQPDLLERAITSLGGPPVIIKLREGTQGVGVIKADSLSSASSIVQALWALEQPVLLQEFIQECKGSDIRAFVVDGKVVGAMRRSAAEGDFRSNLHLGGMAERISLSREMRDVAVAAAALFDLRVAGVDLLESTRGPLITEVNPSPGLEGIEGITGFDVAKAIIRACEALDLERHQRIGGDEAPAEGSLEEAREPEEASAPAQRAREDEDR